MIYLSKQESNHIMNTDGGTTAVDRRAKPKDSYCLLFKSAVTAFRL